MLVRFLSVLLGFMLLPAAAAVHVEIEGLPDAERDNARLRLSIAAASERADLDQAQIERLHQQAEEEIRSALQPYGYYQAQIEAQLSGQAPDWHALYRVQAGAPVHLREVTLAVEGAARELPEVQQVLREAGLRPGERLLHARYEEVKRDLAQTVYVAGFLDARYTTAELRVTPSEQAADIVLLLSSGPRYRFGPTRIEQEELDESVLRRYLQFREGEIFDPRKLLQTQFALADLGYFQTVELEPQREQLDGDLLPVRIKTTPRLRRRYDFGIGYGTDTGARLTTAVELRRLNRSGHKLRGEARVSELKSTLGAEYRIPQGNSAGESLSFSTARIREKFDDGESLRYTAGVSLNRNPGRWQRRAYLEYSNEESALGADINTAQLLTPGVSFNRGETDDAIHTRQGWSLFLDVHGAHGDALSTSTFLQTRALLRMALPLGPRARLSGRAEFGANFVDELSELPASQRFFAGGDQSVRGYAYQSLGPRDSAGKIIGGKYLSTLSLEADTPVWGNWGAALFFDAGGADDKPGPDLSRGVGLGLRYRALVGFVNLDLAHPLDGER